MSEDRPVTVPVVGRIDSTTSSDLQALVDKAFAEHPTALTFDFNDAEYISSAGLRVLLSAKKLCGKDIPMKVINVPLEVKEVFDVTGFSSIMDVEERLRTVDVTGCPMIGAGACGECYRLDEETIIKLYYERISDETIAEEKRLAKQAFVLGVPTAISYDIVRVGNRKGVIYELINAKNLTELMRDDFEHIEEYVKVYVDVAKEVHSIHTNDPGLMDFKDNNRADIPNIARITEEERTLLYRFLDLVPDADTCVHGDLNPNNIMLENGHVSLIDMGEFARGFTMFDLSRIMFTFWFGPDGDDDFYPFFKMTGGQCRKIWTLFVKHYFGADSLEEAAKTNPDAAWVEPLAKFRCVASMLKGQRWSEAKHEEALGYLHNDLIPLIHHLEETGGKIG